MTATAKQFPTRAEIQRERLARRIGLVIATGAAQRANQPELLKCLNSDTEQTEALKTLDKIRDKAQKKYQSAIDDYLAHAKANAVAKKKKKQEELIALLLILMLDAAEEAYATTYTELAAITPAGKGLEPKAEELQTEAAEFAQDRQKNLAGFAGRVYDRLDEVVAETKRAKSEGKEPGEPSEKEIRAAVNKAAEAIKEGQGVVVAETEAQAAAGAAQLRVLERGGFDSAFWVSVGDDRVRHGHLQNEAAGAVQLGKKFPDGCRFPGDPLAPIEATINCRCWLIGAKRK